MTPRRRWAWPLVPLYGAALAAKDAIRAAGMIPEHRLSWPVISVGSLSAGGAGKTPVTMALAELLRRRGWTIDVLSRGYGRIGTDVQKVQPTLSNAAHLFGDEPVLIAERTGVPVWVGASRYAAGRAAEAAAAQDAMPEALDHAPGTTAYAHLLDDGFQHRALQRQFDLVLVTAEDLSDTLLPAGNLREPLTALRRADAFAVREDELETVSRVLAKWSGGDVPIWTLRRCLQFPGPLGVFSAGLRPMAFCALARPESFASMLTESGCGIVDTVVFPDHHRYGERDLTSLIAVAGQLRATGLVTTEKDAVKLHPAMRARLEAEVGPLVIVKLDVHFVYESPVVRALQSGLLAATDGEGAIEARVR